MPMSEAASTTVLSDRVEDFPGCAGRVDGGSIPFWMALSILHFLTSAAAATSARDFPSRSKLLHSSIIRGVITEAPRTTVGA